MKKCLSLLLAAVMTLLCCSAFAESTTGRGDLVVRSESLSAYVDGDGNLWIPGNSQPVNKTKADAIVSIDAYRLIFFSVDDGGKRALLSLDLSTFAEQTLAQDVWAACMGDDDHLFYIPANDRTQLCDVNLENNQTTTAYTAVEQLDRLYLSAEGLVATYVESAGAILRSNVTGAFQTFSGSIPTDSTLADGDQLYLANGSDLYLFRSTSFAADIIDTNVYDYATLGGRIYYIANTGSAVRLKSYDPETMEWKVLGTPDISLAGQLTASESRLFTLGSDSVVYTVDVTTGELTPFATIQANNIPDGWQVDSYSIEAMSGQLNVYAKISEKTDSPSFSFMEFTSDVSDGDRFVLVSTTALEGETKAWDLLQPAPTTQSLTTLRRGQRGEAVRTMQQPLYDLGYYDYRVDGIFGSRTERAIRLLQDDLGRAVNGVADPELQQIILSGTLSKYDPYRAVYRGDRSLRVQMMQSRLRELGYLSDSADGIFGSRTQAAVQLFQRENGFSVEEYATRDTLAALYSDSASPCSSYIDLRKGDSGARVRELNQRLKDLYYLDVRVGDTYTDDTVRAVKKFQSQAGLSITGQATVTVLQRLFSDSAPEYRGYTVLRRGDENSRVERLQRRLKELDYFTANVTGYFGRNTQAAVKLFQQRAGLRPTGVADVNTQKLLYSPDAPKYVKPTIIGTPALTIDCYEKKDGDVYCLTDRCSETGYVTFGWMAEGDVKKYNVTITDDTGAKRLDEDTQLTLTGVSIDALTLNRTYTLTVTAYPEDGDEAHITSASIQFRRIETPVEPDPIGTITEVSASVEPVTRTENNVLYVRAGEITFRWYAIGDVASYAVEIRDSNNNLCLSANTTDEQAVVQSNVMKQGEVYTLYVHAIPTNGTLDNAVTASCAFALEDQPQPLPTVVAPTLTTDLTAEADGSYVVDATAAFQWSAVENAEQYYIEIRDASNALCGSETTTATGYVVNAASLSRGANYTLYVTAIPTGGSVADGATATVAFRVREDQTITQLDAPVLSIQGLQPAADGIVYADDSSLVVQWTAVDGAAAYNFVVRDANQMVVAEATVPDLSLTYNASALVRGAVYTLSVTAVPQDEAHAQGTPATLPLILKVPATAEDAIVTEPSEPTVEEPVEAPTEEPVEQPTEAPAEPTEAPAEQPTEAPVEQPTEAPVEQPTEAPVVSAPTLGIETIVETVDDVAYVNGGVIHLTWSTDTADCAYQLSIYDADGNLCAQTSTTDTSVNLDGSKLADGMIYTFEVVAYANGSDVSTGTAATLRFAKYAVAPTEAPVEQPTEAPAEEPVVEEPTEAPAEQPVEDPAEQPTEAPVEEPPEAPAEQPTEAPVVSAPTLSIETIVETVDDVAYVDGGAISLSWSTDTPGCAYQVSIYDADGNLCAQTNTTDTSINLDGSKLADGMIYTFEVIAYANGSDVSTGTAATLRFAKYAVAPTEAPVEQPTEAPAEEPVVEEPTEAPAEQPVVEEPTEAPAEQPVEQPTEAPAEEPVEEPTEAPVAPTEILPIDGTMPDRIAEMQQRLVDLGWLLPDAYTQGMLDEVTVQAVMDFQNYCISVLAQPLIPMDQANVDHPDNPIVDADTLKLLMDVQNDIIKPAE